MKHIKKFKTFINENFHHDEFSSLIDQIVGLQNDLNPEECEFHTFTVEELNNMDMDQLHQVISDLQVAQATCETVEDEEEYMGEDEEDMCDTHTSEEEENIHHDDGQSDYSDHMDDEYDYHKHHKTNDIDEFEEDITDEDDNHKESPGYKAGLPSELW